MRLPSYQVDRSAFDEEVLRRAAVAGARVLRPASVTGVELFPVASSKSRSPMRDASRTIQARWVVDASGVAAMLARRNGWWRPNTEHPTAACWSRWKGVKDWDGYELAQKFPGWASAVHGTRGTATNHVIGDGWWSWWIPLKGGDTSVGVVFDQRLVEWPEEPGKLGDRLKGFLMRHPVGREMLEGATFDEHDMHWRKNLAYYSTTFAGDGFVLVGDAAAFMDPFYSPGMDWISFTTSGAAELIAAQRAGEPMAERVERHNRDFARSHRCWFEALYKDKYEYMGEFDLLSLAFNWTWDCIIGALWKCRSPPGNRRCISRHSHPRVAKLFAALMGTYNSRFAKIARLRRKEGRLGKSNRNRRCLIPGYMLNRGNMFKLIPLLAKWALLEIREGWRSWGNGTASSTMDSPASEVAAE